jgi:Kef-type K+ transport system membrane component KefB
LGYDLFVILREGASCVDIVELTLAGYSWSEAAQLVLGAEAGTAFLELLRGPYGAQYLQISQAVDLFAHYGVMFVMFHIGLGTYVIAQLRQLEPDSVKVAVIGAFAPMALGLLVISLLTPDTSELEHVFIAATLGTTGTAITALALTRLHQNHSQEARVIFGAAVMDDVLGLVILAIVSGIAVTGSAAFGDIGRTAMRTCLFMIGAFGFGPYFLRFLIRLLHPLNVLEAKLFVSFVMVTFLAGLASLVGLSPIVGAFAAGLLMHESHFEMWGDLHQAKHTIKELFAPLEVIVVPIFFLLMGMQVKLETLFNWEVIYITAGVLAAAILGKWISALGVSRGVNRMAVGFGMMPRGEVGLAFAFIGKSLGVIDSVMFSVLVVMVIITTLATPLMLRLSMNRNL